MQAANDWMLKEDRDAKIAEFEEWRREWDSTRKKGMSRFLFTRGVLHPVVMFGAGFLWSELRHDFHRLPWRGTTAIAIMFLSGPGFAAWEWRRNEKKYRGTAF